MAEARNVDCDGARSDGSVLSGGEVDAAPDPAEGITGYTQEKSDQEFVGAPTDEAREPSQQDGSGGQDAGSME